MKVAVAKLAASFGATGVSIEIAPPSDETLRIGNPPYAVRVVVHTESAWRSLLRMDENAVVEAYLRGDLDIEGSFRDALRFRSALKTRQGIPLLMRFLKPLLQNRSAANRQAIAAHYELDPAFYLAFLDSVWPAYSQGIHHDDDEPLSAAIERKFQFAAESCRIGPDSHVIEIGPGWGAFLRYVQPIGAKVTALTNSERMKAYLDSCFPKPQIQIQHGDFLEFRPAQRFSALTMMGVLEHLPWYDKVCRQISNLLQPGGYAYLDASAARVKYAMTEFIYRHVFPLDHSFLHLDGFLQAARREGLEVVALHDDSENYLRTILCWAKNLDRNRDTLSVRFGQYHFRRFRMYLWGSVHAFETGDLQCHRLVLRTPGGSP
jgi:cyclopropane-fatty-acyl-phospholipid synthase